MGIEVLSELGIFKRFMLHHVAPVAGTVSDGEEDQFVFFFRFGKRRISPRHPINRIVGMLLQVWGIFVDQVVGIRWGHGGSIGQSHCDQKRYGFLHSDSFGYFLFSIVTKVV